MPYLSVRDNIDQIQLDRHGLIEASAGTGKTYTIENLVVRLLKEEEHVDLENILVVTFTEKAASELKIRIREKLEASLIDPELDLITSKKLRLCVDEFDRAAIHTIHGFCQTVLRDFAFENRAPFQVEVVADAPLYETLLKEQMRKDWPGMYGEDLEEVLELSGFSPGKDHFLKTVIRLATSLHEEAGDRLIPDPGEGGFKRAKEAIASACLAVKAAIPFGFSDRYALLNFNKSSRNSILQKIVVPVETHFTKVEGETFNLRALSALMSQVENTRSSDRRGLDCLVPLKWNKGGPNLHVCPELPFVKAGLEEIAGRLSGLRCCLRVEAVHRLQADVALTKEAHGWISYYDMLAQVEKALTADNADDLLKNLRARFKAAFIDEFQDTDPVQWRIFKKIFIDSPDACRSRLFVIGDPKQAIYAFRGADVYAYLAARNEITGLAGKGKAALYSLSVNWRSRPRLIDAFNRLFGRDTWFRPQASAGPFEIGYKGSEAPDKGLGLSKMIEDHSGRPVLTIVDLSASLSPRPAKPRLARFVAREIRHLIETDIRIEEKGRGVRSLGFGDMAILVRARSEVPFLEDALKKENIPYAFYKKPGLFASDEAVYTRLVFHAILEPGDGSAVKKGLLTPFFGQKVEDLAAYEEIPPTHPVKAMLFKWNGYAMTRRWGYLFQSLMEDSGLMARGAGTRGWDRAYANYRQIFEYLKEVAYRKNLDFRGLSALMDLHGNAGWEADEGVDIHQIETESGKVQIMTMHVSKGLQFPVVFVAGGLTERPSQKEAYHVYHPVGDADDASEMMRVFDLLKSGGDGRHELEKVDEDKRLYYVAATRARFKLYVPFYLYEKDGPWLGPVCTLLSPALAEAFPQGEGDSDVLWLRADRHAGGVTPPVPPEAVRQETKTSATIGFDDLLIPDTYEGRRIRVASFSSLHEEMKRGAALAAEDVSFQPAQEEKEADELVQIREMGVFLGEGPPDEMPGGTDVGLMFHGVLEHMDYRVPLGTGPGDRDGAGRLLEDPRTREVIRGQMAAYRVDERWEDAVCRILWNTLTAPIPPLGRGFSLSQLMPEDRLHEAAFYYVAPGRAENDRPMERSGGPERFVRGVIDLIFRKDGRYYVADWKSNLSETGYDPASMSRSMADADYHLQYKLYTVAALRWLRQSLGERFNPATHWGGVFYFYLRGMGGAPGDGIFFVPPEELGSLGQIEEEMARLLGT